MDSYTYIWEKLYSYIYVESCVYHKFIMLHLF